MSAVVCLKCISNLRAESGHVAAGHCSCDSAFALIAASAGSADYVDQVYLAKPVTMLTTQTVARYPSSYFLSSVSAW